jgi:hypothetical protein
VVSFTVRVDVHNPAQFFACCGLLEAAARLAHGARGRFAAPPGGRGAWAFEVEGGPPLADVVKALAAAEVVPVAGLSPPPGRGGEEKGAGAPCVAFEWPAAVVPAVPGPVYCQWWVTDRTNTAKYFKCWAGRQTPVQIAQAVQTALAAQAKARVGPDLFFRPAVPVRPGTKAAPVSPFGFDPRRGDGTARGAGFSADDAGVRSISYPAVDLFCLVGLARFRPVPVTGPGDRFRYWPWGRLHPPAVAWAAAAGLLPDAPGRRPLEFRSVAKTKYVKTITPAGFLP